MINFGENLKNFSFDFRFQAKTGENSWSVSFGNKTGELDYSGINQIESLNIESTFIDDFQNNLFIANYNDQKVIAYEFIDNQLTFNNLITGENVGNNAGFGYAIDSIRDYLLIGAPFTNQNSGKLFFHNKNTINGIGTSGNHSFGQIMKIDGTAENGFFGSYISSQIFRQNNVIAISATGENNTGAVYLYKNNGLSFMEKIQPIGNGINLFGKHTELFSIDEKKHIGVSYEIDQTGYVNLYKEDEFTKKFVLSQTITSSDSHANNSFGNQIIFTDNKLFISSPREKNSGAVYQYDYIIDNGQFNEVKKFQETDVESQDFFGKTMDFNESFGIITSNQNSGKAYLYNYRNNEWDLHAEINSSGNSSSGAWGGNLDNGHCVAINNNNVIIGSYEESILRHYQNELTKVNDIDYTGFTFSGNNGKIYDINHRFIYGYNPDKLVKISGNVFEKNVNLFINDQLINSIDQRSTGFLNSYQISGVDSFEFYSISIGK